MTDDELREELRFFDRNEDATVDSWEANFIESVAYKSKGPLSEKQRQKAEQIIEKYKS